MARIYPFRGIFYNRELVDLASVVAPPYDVISGSEQEGFYKRDPHNIIRLILGRGENWYDKAKRYLYLWQREGILIEDTRDSFYLYEQEWRLREKSGVMRGIVCSLGVESYDEKVIFPHERTLSAPKKDRLKLLCTTKTNFSPIMMLFSDEKNELFSDLKFSELISQFEYEEGLSVRLWRLEEVERIADCFLSKQLIIADGHHRYETALSFPAKRVMTLLLEKDRSCFCILAAHRIIKKRLNRKRLRSQFDVERIEKENILSVLSESRERGVFGMVDQDGGFILRAKRREGLDVAILHSSLLDGDFTEGEDVVYTVNEDEVFLRVEKREADCGIFLRPTSPDDVINTATSLCYMPGKATYFFPKPFSGVVMHRLNLR